MKLLYFAWVRENIGRSQEYLTLPQGVITLSNLADYLENKDENYAYAFKFRNKVKVAINQNHVDWNHHITDEDEIAFFPPITGG
ncbi:MAG: molybdopterin converting factor subunit 1 [Sphingomonadales bacterium]